MEKFVLSQLFNAIKSRYFSCEYFRIGSSEQLIKVHNFRKIIFVTSSLQNSEKKGFTNCVTVKFIFGI